MNIYYKSDFRIQESGDPIDITTAFRFTYRTSKSYSGEVKSYIASFDGAEYTNCKRLDDGSVLVFFENHNLDSGCMQVLREFFIDDSDFASGIYTRVTFDKLDVNLVCDSSYDQKDNIETTTYYNVVKGDNGASAYELWLNLGNTGSLDDFFEFYRGNSYTLTDQDKIDIAEIASENTSYSISTHNNSTAAHNDIRTLLNNVIGLPTYNSSTHTLTFLTTNGESFVVDLPIEQMALSYNSTSNAIEFANADGTTTSIPVVDFVSEYLGSTGDNIRITIGTNNTIGATLLDGSIGSSKFSTTIQSLLSNIVRYDVAETRSETERANARNSLDLMDYSTMRQYFYIKSEVDDAISGVSSSTGSDLNALYDVVITTQDEFDALIASDTWLGATSVAIVGLASGASYVKNNVAYDESDGTNYDVLYEDHKGIVIPYTVTQIHGYKNPIITVSNIWGLTEGQQSSKHDIGGALTYGASFGLANRYETDLFHYCVKDLTVVANADPYVIELGSNGMGYDRTTGISNIPTVINCTGIAEGLGAGSGISYCYNVNKCVGKDLTADTVDPYDEDVVINAVWNNKNAGISECLNVVDSYGIGRYRGISLCSPVTRSTGIDTTTDNNIDPFGIVSCSYVSYCKASSYEYSSSGINSENYPCANTPTGGWNQTI